MISLTKEDAELYGDIFTFVPYWANDCGHSPESYVCSFRIILKVEEGKRVPCDDKYDLYLFESRGSLELCIRYGNEPSQYCSPGDAVEFMLKNNPNYGSFIAQDIYDFVGILLRKYGKLKFTWKEVV